MKNVCLLFLMAGVLSAQVLLSAERPPAKGPNARSLFDGKTLANWEGDPKLWRVQDGCLTGGSLTQTVTHNDFLASTRDFTNFVIRFQIKLTGTEGFINSGFQIRSQRVPNNSEMSGYQCDYGEPNWYGAIYDESRRDRVMAPSDMKALGPVIKRQDWNDYVIRADGPRVTTWINGVMGTDYTEADPNIPDWGKFGIQVHGGGKALVQVRNVFIDELPPTAPGKVFRGAPEPGKAPKPSPLSPGEEKQSFSLPPGFEIELVASEDMEAGFGKFVAIDWDQHGNLWTMTALEYPVDANENPAFAKELYASHARDKVLVYQRDPKSVTGYASKPRVFTDGLAIPLGILPYKNGVYVQHGQEIVFMSDTDGDGKADKRDVILSGFGVQDSHLFPHQFTRAPGNWIWMAQGAFNYGKVKTTSGKEQQFDQTRMAKFRHDGSDFIITSQGPCNIWGLVLDGNGQAWIQEANDYGYPMMPFHEYANYPGCSNAQWKSYAPEFPGTAPDFQMGGTGLSGLAQSDATDWPEAYANIFYIANPITRKIQAIKVTSEGPRWHYQKLPDFVLSSDEWFRPVALRLGPDGCLYFVDWYNKIISHNEVPRNHPERDKKRGRIWRVKHHDQKPLDAPDFARLPANALLAKLGGASTPQSHLAWQAIGDREMKSLAPNLRQIVANPTEPARRRIAALWALEALDAKEPISSGAEFSALVLPLLDDANRNIRREGIRSLATHWPSLLTDKNVAARVLASLDKAADDSDPEVRGEVIRTAATSLSLPVPKDRALAILARLARPSIDGTTMKSTSTGRVIKTGEAYERDFERYLVRFLLEQHPAEVESFLDSDSSRSFGVENRLLLALSLEPKTSAPRVAELLPELGRPPGQEEVLRLAEFLDQPAVAEALKRTLQNPATSTATVEALLRVRTKLNAEKLVPLLDDSARQLLTDSNPARVELGARVASSFQLASLEPDLVRVLQQGWPASSDSKPLLLEPQRFAALRALRELKSDRVDLFSALAQHGGPAEQETAIGALGGSRDPKGPQQLAKLYSEFSAVPRRMAIAAMSSSRPGAKALVQGVRNSTIPKDELDAPTFDKLHAVLGDDPDFRALMQEMASLFRPALRLDGSDKAWTAPEIALDGPFTVETWIRLDPGIDNNDGILGAPGVLDMNFYGAQFRVWVGGAIHDAIIAKKKITADSWVHIAVTREEDGRLRIYQNGELDNDQGAPVKTKFEHLRIGWTAPPQGTAGWLTEFRVWNRARSPEEIRNEFDRSFESESRPAGLVYYFPGRGPWGQLQSGAQITKTMDFPPLLTAAEAKSLATKFEKFRALAQKPGDRARGQETFKTVCMTCHSVGGQGAQVGPVLNGAGANGLESLLRNVLTPNAAMEAGYRLFRVELLNGDVLDGIRLSEDNEAIVLRRPNLEDTRIPKTSVRHAAFTHMSMMPEGLLDALEPQQVSDLFAYLATLK